MHITPYGRMTTSFDLLSQMGKVTPRPKNEAPRSTQREARAEPEPRSSSERHEGEALTPVGEERNPQARTTPPRGHAAGGAGTGEQVATSPARSDGNKAQVQAQPGLIARSGQPQTTHPTDNAGTGPVELLQQGARPAQTFSGQTAMPALQSFVRAAVQSNTAQSQGTALSPTSGTSRTRQSQARPEQVQRTSYTPRSEKMVELAREQRDSVFRSIALALSEKGGKAHIQLDPRALGNLAVQMELSGDKLKLEVRVEREELATVMREDLPKLQQQLESRGLVVESINVQTSSREEQQQQALEFARSQRGSLGNSFEANNSLEEGAELGGLLGRGIGLRQGEGINFLA